MLHEDERFIKPLDIKEQVPWEKFDAVVILGLSSIGNENEIWMSTLTIDELSFLTAQLNAHLSYKLGPLKEGDY